MQILIEMMQQMNPLLIKGFIFIFCMASIIFITKFYGEHGLYVYSIVAIISANIQVLKAVRVDFLDHPLPLGNMVFTSLFLTNDIITELYGKKSAQKNVMLGFIAYLSFSVIMILAAGIKPLSETDPEYAPFIESHHSINMLFSPTLALLVSSLAAYLISMMVDISIFHFLKKMLKDQLLWFRTFISTSIGIIVDNTIFTFLAWVVFAIIPISFNTILNSYILGTLKIRIVLTIITIPVFYVIKKLVKRPTIND